MKLLIKTNIFYIQNQLQIQQMKIQKNQKLINIIIMLQVKLEIQNKHGQIIIPIMLPKDFQNQLLILLEFLTYHFKKIFKLFIIIPINIIMLTQILSEYLDFLVLLIFFKNHFYFLFILILFFYFISYIYYFFLLPYFV